MKPIRGLVGTLIWLLIINSSEETSREKRKNNRRKRNYSQAYQQYLQRYNTYKRMYYQQFNPEKVKGRCAYSPKWMIDGRNPVYEKAQQGYVIILYLISKNCKICYNELKSLHIWATYFKKIDKKVAIIALNKRHNHVSQYTIDRFPLIKIYQEPRTRNIFKQLNGKAGDVLVYDQCGRHLYYFGYPYSSLVQPFVRLAVQNTEYHYKTMCGPCSNIKTKNNLTTDEMTTTQRPHIVTDPTVNKRKTAKVIQQAANVPTAYQVNINSVTTKPPTTNPTMKSLPTKIDTTKGVVTTLKTRVLFNTTKVYKTRTMSVRLNTTKSPQNRSYTVKNKTISSSRFLSKLHSRISRIWSTKGPSVSTNTLAETNYHNIETRNVTSTKQPFTDNTSTEESFDDVSTSTEQSFNDVTSTEPSFTDLARNIDQRKLSDLTDGSITNKPITTAKRTPTPRPTPTPTSEIERFIIWEIDGPYH